MGFWQNISTYCKATLTGRKFVGVDFYLDENDKIEYRACLIKIGKSDINIEDTLITSDSSRMLNFIGNLPLIIVLNGHGIIQKCVNTSVEIQEAFPGLNEEEVITQSIQNNSQKWMNVIRRSKLSEIIHEAGVVEHQILEAFLGASFICNHLELFDERPDSIHHIEITWHEDLLTNVSYSSETNQEAVHFFGHPVEFTFIFLALVEFSQKFQVSLMDFTKLNSRIQNYLFNRLSKILNLGFALSLFTFLLINYAITYNLNKEFQILNAELEGYELLSSKSIKHEAETKETKQLFTKLYGKRDISFTNLVEDLMLSVPNKVLLSSTEVFPDVFDKQSKQISILENQIKINGQAKELKDLNAFLKELGNLRWAKELTLLNSSYSNSKEAIEFDILIEL